jgi:phosphohistidine phosphatase
MHVKGDELVYKVLLILRHAKSSWKNKKLDDHDRPLNKRGKREAVEMGRYLKKINMIPDSIVTSSALRAIETTTLVCRNCNYDKLVEVNFAFHKGGADAYVHAISTTSNDTNKLLIVGHNPDLEDLIRVITHGRMKLTTCTLIKINMYIKNWESASLYDSFKSEIVNVWRPRRIE